MLARKRGGVTPIESHPTSAIWVRYRGVKDLDGVEVAGTDPADPYARAVLASRRLATNHFTGWGYWIWLIPLQGGETSVGLVWDKRLLSPEGSTPLEKLQRLLDSNPLTRELLEHAQPIAEDVRSYGHLPYFVDRYIGPGWACVGDAGGFLDPFYSPGLDQMAFSVHSRVVVAPRLLLPRPQPAGASRSARPGRPRRRCRRGRAAIAAGAGRQGGGRRARRRSSRGSRGRRPSRRSTPCLPAPGRPTVR